MKSLILFVVLMCSTSSFAALSEYQCLGQFKDLSSNESLLVSFDYNFASDVDANVEQQAILNKGVYIDPMLTNEDTAGWSVDQLVNFKTNFITDYSVKGCPNDSSKSPVKFSTSDKTDGVFSLTATISCGDGFGAGWQLTGYCKPKELNE